MVYGLRDAPLVTLQSSLTLLQCDTMYCFLDLSIMPGTQMNGLFKFTKTCVTGPVFILNCYMGKITLLIGKESLNHDEVGVLCAQHLFIQVQK